MTTRTITALYEQKADAERARDSLKSAGFNQGIEIHDEGAANGKAPGGFMEKLKEFFGGHEDAAAYGEGVRRGHFLLTAKVEEMDATRAASILEASNAIDFDRAQAQWRTEGWAPPAAPKAMAQSKSDEQMIPIVEERLRVGKHEVERGGVSVRSYVVETPVHEQIGLREERVTLERRAVDRPVTSADASFKDRTIELTETAEEAVIAKDAVVREELVIHKQTSERTQDINDTVRRTEVEVDDTTSGGKPKTAPTSPRPI